ncbi:MAG: 1-acyl-sn-glycerol-3-phosphate acyltransferase, partial [Clostridia bacterium]|nr:1-acyl-sn-glycerol-3-phosphate acyltransferase [Clostridia bacterium]
MKKYTFIHFLVLWFTKLTGIIPCLLFYKPRVHLMNEKTSRRLPKPAILMSNHKSLLDFPLYVMLFPFRTIRFQMAEVLYNKNKIFAWFLHCLGGIRVNRDTQDMAFIGNTLEILDRGGTVGIFPEGRLPVNGVPWPFKPSIAYIALH